MKRMQVALTGLAAVLMIGTAALAAGPPKGYWGDAKQWRDVHSKIVGQPMPTLNLSHWVNSKPLTREDLKGQIVVVDFWATWCGPCLRALPHNNDMMDKYAGKGVTILAICGSSSGQSKMPAIVEQKKLRFPVARDAKQVSAKAWGVMWWPTYAVVDRAGIVRGVGLSPSAVEGMVDRIMKEQPYKPGAAEQDIPRRWLEGSDKQRARLATLEAVGTPPALQVENWMNSEALDLDELKGKVVVLDFWATWCGPCIKSIPHANELYETHKDDGLVIIGVTHPRGGENMAGSADKHGINYPIALDANGDTIKAYGVNGFPDYYLIDRAGNLRIADCSNSKLDEAIAKLLAEPVPGEEDEAEHAEEDAEESVGETAAAE